MWLFCVSEGESMLKQLFIWNSMFENLSLPHRHQRKKKESA
ncbi:hypothetical protein EMIT040CA3_20252 [Bacillus pseudomycoides]